VSHADERGPHGERDRPGREAVKPAFDSDPLLRQFERDTVVVCLAMAVAALVLRQGRPDAAAGVVAGGALMALSYLAIKGGVDLVIAAASKAARPAKSSDAEEEPGDAPERPALPAGRRAWLAVKFFGRYALLAVGAYVMLACFRVHPVGLMAGATAPFVAAAVHLMRSSRASSGRGHP
jgi:hypothetical protein